MNLGLEIVAQQVAAIGHVPKVKVDSDPVVESRLAPVRVC